MSQGPLEVQDFHAFCDALASPSGEAASEGEHDGLVAAGELLPATPVGTGLSAGRPEGAPTGPGADAQQMQGMLVKLCLWLVSNGLDVGCEVHCSRMLLWARVSCWSAGLGYARRP